MKVIKLCRICQDLLFLRLINIECEPNLAGNWWMSIQSVVAAYAYKNIQYLYYFFVK